MVLTGTRDEAEDLMQATLLKALENGDRYGEQGKIDAWLFTIARRLWLNRCRARRIRYGNGVAAIEEAGIAANQPDVETNILARQVLERIMALPPEQRQAVFLVYGEGRSYREAAEIMDCPVGTIMSRLAAVRRKLNREIGERSDR